MANRARRAYALRGLVGVGARAAWVAALLSVRLLEASLCALEALLAGADVGERARRARCACRLAGVRHGVAGKAQRARGGARLRGGGPRGTVGADGGTIQRGVTDSTKNTNNRTPKISHNLHVLSTSIRAHNCVTDVPAAHREHAVCPVLPVILPAAHWLHTDKLDCDANRPVAHGSQVRLSPSCEDAEPAAQDVHPLCAGWSW